MALKLKLDSITKDARPGMFSVHVQLYDDKTGHIHETFNFAFDGNVQAFRTYLLRNEKVQAAIARIRNEIAVADKLKEALSAIKLEDI